MLFLFESRYNINGRFKNCILQIKILDSWTEKRLNRGKNEGKNVDRSK